MTSTADFSVTMGYLLVLRAVVAIAFVAVGRSGTADTPQSSGTRLLQWLLQVLYAGPVLVVLAKPWWVEFGVIPLADWMRWAGVVPATIGLWLLMVTWLGALRRRDGQPKPLRQWVRYPCEVADVLFYLALAWIGSNWLLLFAWAVASLAQLLLMVAREEQLRQQTSGQRGAAIGLIDGQQRLAPIMERQYTVPKRFGMSAIVALITTFGLVFGALKYMNTPPVVYLFIATEIAAICLAQILFGSAPRGGSVITGAILLPFWAAVTMGTGPRWMPWEMLVISYVSLVAFGGLLGYCIGALAAGFFLVSDLLDQFLVRDGDGEDGRWMDGAVPVSAGQSERDVLSATGSSMSDTKGIEDDDQKDLDARGGLRGGLRSHGPVPDPHHGGTRSSRRVPGETGR